MAQVKAQIDKLLTNVSQGLFVEGGIADLIFPTLSVKQKTGLLAKYGKSHLRIEHSLVGGRGKYRRVEPIVRSSSGYSVESHGLEGMVTEDDYRNVELPYKAEEDEVKGLTHHILLEKEFIVASALTSTSTLTQNVTLAGTNQLSDYNSSDPIGVFKTARLAVYDGCGLPPNKAIMDWKTMNTLAYHPAILDALGFTQNRAGQLSEAELAKALGVEKLFVGKVVYNTAKEGQTDALSPVWGKNIVFYYAPDSAAPYQQSLGYKIQLEGQGSKRVFKYAIDNPPNSTGILVDDSYQHLVSDVGAGYLVKNAIA